MQNGNISFTSWRFFAIFVSSTRNSDKTMAFWVLKSQKTGSIKFVEDVWYTEPLGTHKNLNTMSKNMFRPPRVKGV